MKSIHAPEVKAAPPQTWTNCKVHNGQFFISGMTAHDLSGGVEGDGSMYDQSRRTFQKIRHLVEACGAAMDDIIQLNVFVTRIEERQEVWRARKEFFTGDFPCCTLVEVTGLATPALKVEINATGFIGGRA
ncbi:RidA family protein [Pigmentiphaga sp. H8]|uniref:RidA family protein n=1 Tax=unclassified Pigmentiphaga TaxID=2626614 RepID=UPI000F598BB4|nr:RidA family protein [Pigmentiphaga sp. H8]AZG09394.1 RidA family protein [Pigmentiphaga sp. H8]